MTEVAWAALGLLAAGCFGNLWYLGAKMDALAARLDARIDASTARLDARIDALNGQIKEHMEHHAS